MVTHWSLKPGSHVRTVAPELKVHQKVSQESYCMAVPYRDKAVQREYQRNWMRQRRNEFFAGKQCVKCGSIEKLELDHMDPNKKVSHRVWSWSKERREAEIAKCQVLCEKCHLEKTKGDLKEMNEHPLVHGTIAGYKKGCTCEPCHDALLAWWKGKRAADPQYGGRGKQHSGIV